MALIYGAGDDAWPFWFSAVTRGWNDVPMWGYESRLTNSPMHFFCSMLNDLHLPVPIV